MAERPALTIAGLLLVPVGHILSARLLATVPALHWAPATLVVFPLIIVSALSLMRPHWWIPPLAGLLIPVGEFVFAHTQYATRLGFPSSLERLIDGHPEYILLLAAPIVVGWLMVIFRRLTKRPA